MSDHSNAESKPLTNDGDKSPIAPIERPADTTVEERKPSEGAPYDNDADPARQPS